MNLPGHSFGRFPCVPPLVTREEEISTSLFISHLSTYLHSCLPSLLSIQLGKRACTIYDLAFHKKTETSKFFHTCNTNFLSSPHLLQTGSNEKQFCLCNENTFFPFLMTNKSKSHQYVCQPFSFCNCKNFCKLELLGSAIVPFI